jgi:golgi-specific brefeldin A-resistance guanine nucleotide exchange factor 1
VTAAALVSVRKLVHAPLLMHFPAPAVARTMHAVVVALSACKFEATNPWHDQAVLTRILQTLEACIASPSGRMLSNADACAVFQAVYRIGFDTQVVQELSGAPGT